EGVHPRVGRRESVVGRQSRLSIAAREMDGARITRGRQAVGVPSGDGKSARDTRRARRREAVNGEGRTGSRINLGNKSILIAAVRLLQGTGGRWEVRGSRLTDHVGAAGRVHGDARAKVVAAAAKVAGIGQRGACVVDFGDEGVIPAAY